MKLATLTLAALMAVCSVAQAAPIDASSATFAGTVIDFNFDDSYLATLPSLLIEGPLDLGSGVTFYSDKYSEIGANVSNLEDNGLWSVIGNSNRDGYFIATNFTRNSGSIDFEFDTPMQQVGIFVNQYQAIGQTNNAFQILAYDMIGNILESFTASVDTDAFGYDEGKFVGFARASADIYGFSLSDGLIVVDNLTISAVPEPETYAMFLAGLGLLGAASRRRRA
jgi:hypothetical protein